MNDDANSRVALAEIRGDVKLILAGQERTTSDIHAIRRTLERHDARLAALETDRTRREGQERGITATVKTLWLAGGAVVTAIVLGALRKLGLL